MAKRTKINFDGVVEDINPSANRGVAPGFDPISGSPSPDIQNLNPTNSKFKFVFDDGVQLQVDNIDDFKRIMKDRFFVNWDNLFSRISGIDHETLTNLLGGATNNHYHVTPAELAKIEHSNRLLLDAIDQLLGTTANVTFNSITVDSLSVLGFTPNQHLETDSSGNIVTVINKTAFNKIFETDSGAMKMNGTPSAGISDNVSRSDHVHPSDTSKQNTIVPGDILGTSHQVSILNGSSSTIGPDVTISLPQDIDYSSIPQFASVTLGDLDTLSIVQTDSGKKLVSVAMKTAYNQAFETNVSNIKMNGTPSVGISSNIARADHIHLSDSTKADKLILPVVGNILNVDANGNPHDSGFKFNDSGVTNVDIWSAYRVLNAIVDAISGLSGWMKYKGVIDCSTNPNYPAAAQGEVYIVSVSGKIGGSSGIDVEIGDMLLCKADSLSGDQALVGQNWDILQVNINGAVTSEDTSTVVNNIVVEAGTTGKTIKQSLASIDTFGSINIPSGQKFKINNVNLAPSDIGAEPSFSKNTAFNVNFETDTNNIKMNGSVSVGTLSAVAKSDHIHPTDTSRVAANVAIVGATKTKITYDSKGLVTSGADATTADIAASTDKNYVTDAQLLALGSISGSNTGDVTLDTNSGLAFTSGQSGLKLGTPSSLSPLSINSVSTNTHSHAVSGFELTLTKGNLTESTSSILTIVGGSGAIIGSGVTIQVAKATASADGYLSKTDWSTFNGKQSALSFTDLVGTSNQISVLNGLGAIAGGTQVTLSLPQDIATGSDVTFKSASLTDGLKDVNVITAVHIGDSSNVSLSTNNKTILGSINEIFAALPLVQAGPITDVTVTHVGSGVINISSIDAYFNTMVDFSGQYKVYTLPAVLGATLTPGIYYYITAQYNAGSPQYSIITDNTVVNHSTILNVAQVYYDSSQGIVHIFRTGTYGLGLANKMAHRAIHTDRFGYESGLAISEKGTRNVKVTEGYLWYDGLEIHQVEVDTTLANNNIDFWYQVGGNWTNSLITQYNNTQYMSGGALHSLSINRYAVNWIYSCVCQNETIIFMVLGGGDYHLNEAQASPAPIVPSLVAKQGKLVGRIIVKNGDSVATQIDSAFTQVFAMASVINHNDLANLGYAESGHIGFEPTVTKGNLTETVTSSLTIVGGTGAVIGSGVTISLPQDIKTTSTPSFADVFNVTLNRNSVTVGTDTKLNTGIPYGERAKFKVLPEILSLSSISWSRVGTVITVTSVAHGINTGSTIKVTASSQTTPLPLGDYAVTKTGADTFTIVGVNSGATSGTMSYTGFRMSLQFNGVNTSFAFYINDKKFIVTATELPYYSLTKSPVEGVWFFYIHQTTPTVAAPVIILTQTPWAIYDPDVLLFNAYVNATDSVVVWCGEERHTAGRDIFNHARNHAQGAVYSAGFLGSQLNGITAFTTDNSNAYGRAQIQIANGSFFDEDIKNFIQHSGASLAATMASPSYDWALTISQFLGFTDLAAAGTNTTTIVFPVSRTLVTGQAIQVMQGNTTTVRGNTTITAGGTGTTFSVSTVTGMTTGDAIVVGARIPIYYISAVNSGVYTWKKLASSDFLGVSITTSAAFTPANIASQQASYNNATSGGFLSVNAGRYYPIYLLATNSILDPVIAILGSGQSTNTNLATALGEAPFQFSNLVGLTGLGIQEIVPFYRLTFEYNTGGAFTTCRLKLRDLTFLNIRLATVSGSVIGGTPASVVASQVSVDTTNFDGWLNSGSSNVQAALEALDDQGKIATIITSLTVPTIYGSSSASGTLSLGSTSHATKATVEVLDKMQVGSNLVASALVSRLGNVSALYTMQDFSGLGFNSYFLQKAWQVWLKLNNSVADSMGGTSWTNSGNFSSILPRRYTYSLFDRGNESIVAPVDTILTNVFTLQAWIKVPTYTQQILHFENNATDETGNSTWTANGSCFSAVSPKFGSYCFVGSATPTTNYIASTLPNLSSKDFTLEFWFYSPASGTTQDILKAEYSTSGMVIRHNPNAGQIYLYLASGAGGYDIASNVTLNNAPAGQWNKLVMEQKSGTGIKVWIMRGDTSAWTNEYTYSGTKTLVNTGEQWRIGGSDAPFQGKVDEFRLTINKLVYEYGTPIAETTAFVNAVGLISLGDTATARSLDLRLIPTTNLLQLYTSTSGSAWTNSGNPYNGTKAIVRDRWYKIVIEHDATNFRVYLWDGYTWTTEITYASSTALYAVAGNKLKLGFTSFGATAPGNMQDFRMVLATAVYGGTTPNLYQLGVGSVNNFGSLVEFDDINGNLDFYISSAPGAADASSLVVKVMTLSYLGFKTTLFFQYDLGSKVAGTYNIDWADSECQTLTLAGNITLTFTNPRKTVLRLIVKHAGAGSNYTVTFPSAFTLLTDGASARVYTCNGSATTRFTSFDVYFDGTQYFIADSSYHA